MILDSFLEMKRLMQIGRRRIGEMVMLDLRFIQNPNGKQNKVFSEFNVMKIEATVTFEAVTDCLMPYGIKVTFPGATYQPSSYSLPFTRLISLHKFSFVVKVHILVFKCIYLSPKWLWNDTTKIFLSCLHEKKILELER